MSYWLVLIILSAAHNQPVVQQVGPFADVIACERAAGQAAVLETTGIPFVRSRVEVRSFCAATRSLK